MSPDRYTNIVLTVIAIELVEGRAKQP